MKRCANFLAAVVLVAGLLSGCGKNNPTAPSMTAPAGGKISFAIDVSGEPAANVVSGKVTITKGSLTQTQLVTISGHTGTITFSSIQVGNWTIAAQLFDKDGIEIYTGNGTAVVNKDLTTTVTITVNHNTGTLQIVVKTPTPASALIISYRVGLGLYLTNLEGADLGGFGNASRGPVNCRGGNTLVYPGPPSPFPLHACNLDGSNDRFIHLVYNGPEVIDAEGPWLVNWSWDGTKLGGCIHTGSSWISKICTFNPDGSNVTILPGTSTTSVDTFCCWTPDNRIIYSSNESNYYYCINADGSNRTQLTNLPSGANLSDCSADYTLLFEYNAQVCVMNINGNGFVQLASGHQPAFSADGQKIVFIRYYHSDNGYERYDTLFVMNRDGSNLIQLNVPKVVIDDPHFVY